MVEFGGHSVHAGYIGPNILGRLVDMVFLLGYIRQGELRLVGADGDCCYMYTFVLVAES